MKVSPLFMKVFLKYGSFERNLILWAISADKSTTPEIMKDFVEKYFDFKFENETKSALYKEYKDNQAGRVKTAKKRMSKQAVDDLVRWFKDIDGTLLVDLVYQFARDYYIFLDLPRTDTVRPSKETLKRTNILKEMSEFF